MDFWHKRINPTVVTADNSPSEKDGVVTTEERAPDNVVTDHILQPGELSIEDDVAGGLGRHLGLYSTTFLMYGSHS